ncbi:putative olfactory receptor 5AK3 [Elephas maximus indicus]|uniref:putative olfactory receptor 5AK3 n=1 Tax=Elephas maximus indicus TaxID=99487 RepID=UPI00211619E3|nr:putative olfactory receptor 5AK3 [Elephas maximus indicus]
MSGKNDILKTLTLHSDLQTLTIAECGESDKVYKKKLTGIKWAAHTLQLVTKGVIKDAELEELIRESHELVLILHIPTLSTKSSENDLRKPVLDCPTRWNSIYTMLETLLRCRILCGVLAENNMKYYFSNDKRAYGTLILEIFKESYTLQLQKPKWNQSGRISLTTGLLVAVTQQNATEVTEFFLLGFGGQHKFRHALFTVFLVIYVTSIAGNIGMILLIKTDPRLQTPMYFFLQHLAFVDICYTSAITPKMLQNFIVENKLISFMGCVIQLLVYATFATTDGYRLATMAVDRYIAICNPLRYPIVMSWTVCIQLVVGSYVMGTINASVHTGFTFSLSFCKSNIINHFFCDVPPILSLSCSSININIMLLLVFVGFNLMSTLMVVIFSYTYILGAILKMSSTAGRKKAFSTCASHLTAVTIFYGTLSYMYLQPHSNNAEENMKVASTFYGIVIPVLNPLIYSLRNKEVKEALKVMGKKL